MTKQFRTSLFMFALVIASAFTLAPPDNSCMPFEDMTFEEAIAKGKAEHRLVMVDFRADWCRPCIQMERQTFTDSALCAYSTANFICLKIDIDKSPDRNVKSKFSVFQYPTILLLNPETQETVLRLIGFKTAEIMHGDLKAMRRPEGFPEY